MEAHPPVHAITWQVTRQLERSAQLYNLMLEERPLFREKERPVVEEQINALRYVVTGWTKIAAYLTGTQLAGQKTPLSLLQNLENAIAAADKTISAAEMREQLATLQTLQNHLLMTTTANENDKPIPDDRRLTYMAWNPDTDTPAKA